MELATNFPLPYKVTSVGKLFRVSGTRQGVRLRRHFVDADLAAQFCEEENARAVERENEAMRERMTRLSSDQLAEAEAAFAQVAGRWPLLEVVGTGIQAILGRSKSALLPDLLKEWLGLVEAEVGGERLKELRNCCTRFANDEGTPAESASLTRQMVRAYIDRQDWAPATKRNNRNALHRWFDWMLEHGYLASNPAAGVRIRRSRGPQGLPSVLTATQAAALMATTARPDCRRLKGWLALCLFLGLRPSEAARLTWPEVDFAAGEVKVFGRKRGAKPRIVPLNDAARAWLQSAKADGEETPGYRPRALFRLVVDTANAALAEADRFSWREDILRHSFASYASGNGVSIDRLAEQMGNSPGTIYSHYRHPRPAAEVKAFWEIRPS